jgi:nitric-oxide synthase
MTSQASALRASAPGDPAIIADEAEAFLELLVEERACDKAFAARRMRQVRAEIARTTTYRHTQQELEYGAAVAWRNNTRCVGRLHWSSLTVRDLRHLETADEIFAGLVEHLRIGTNGGKLRPLITVFQQQVPGEQGVRIWNPQLIRYAGYAQPDGSVVGDGLHVELTQFAQALGWKAPGTAFDVLPLIIQMPDERPRLFELPADCVLEVPLAHPEYGWFADLGLKWHALPAISDMRLEIGGVSYTAAPFNGWYVGFEIGARNLSDESRYDMLPAIAGRMGLDTRTNRSLWRDRALLELNAAVLYSFSRAGVTVVDHHAVTRQFVHHEEKERRLGRVTPADWSWVVPPISASTTPTFHRQYQNVLLKPNFFYQPAPWKEAAAAGRCPLH